MNTDSVARKLKDRRLDVVSKATGIHRNTLAKIRDGIISDPRSSTIAKLREYFEKSS